MKEKKKRVATSKILGVSIIFLVVTVKIVTKLFVSTSKLNLHDMDTYHMVGMMTW